MKKYLIVFLLFSFGAAVFATNPGKSTAKTDRKLRKQNYKELRRKKPHSIMEDAMMRSEI